MCEHQVAFWDDSLVLFAFWWEERSEDVDLGDLRLTVLCLLYFFIFLDKHVGRMISWVPLVLT